MNRLLVYIFFLLLPLPHYAWQQDTIVADTVTVDEYYDDNYQEEHAAAEPPPAPVYQQKSFDKDFKKRYTDEDFNYKPVTLEQNWAQKLFAWIRDVLKAIFGDSDTEQTKTTNGRGFPVYELLAVICLFIAVYFVARALLQKEGYWIFGRSGKNISSKDLTVENLHEMDFAALINQTKAQQDYRLALRYYYLWLLKKMAAGNVIEWNWEKTNSDYYYEIKDSTLRESFEYLSYVYDYSWYGEFSIDEKSFIKAELAFKKTLNTL